MNMYQFKLKISLNFGPRCPINNIPTLVQKMAWRQLGDKPLSQPMLINRRIYASLGLSELKCIQRLIDVNKCQT